MFRRERNHNSKSNFKQIKLTWRRPGQYSKMKFIKTRIYIWRCVSSLSLGMEESWRLWNDHPATSRENQHSHRIPERLKRCDAYWQGRKKSSSTGNATWSMTWIDFEGNNRRPAISRENQHSHRTPERQNNYHAYSTGQKKSWSTDMVVNITWWNSMDS